MRDIFDKTFRSNPIFNVDFNGKHIYILDLKDKSIDNLFLANRIFEDKELTALHVQLFSDNVLSKLFLIELNKIEFSNEPKYSYDDLFPFYADEYANRFIRKNESLKLKTPFLNEMVSKDPHVFSEGKEYTMNEIMKEGKQLNPDRGNSAGFNAFIYYSNDKYFVKNCKYVTSEVSSNNKLSVLLKELITRKFPESDENK